jgi:sugar phosphate isomerase/epimerase
MKFAICNEIFQGVTFQEACASAAKAGYHAVEIAPFTLANSVEDISQSERQKIRATAERHGLEIAGLHWLLVKPEGLYLNHPDLDIRARTANYFCALVDFCADIGGKVMIAGSPKQRNLMAGVSKDQGGEWAAATFHNSVRKAEQHGITICIEPLAPVETNFINTAAEAIHFAQRIASPNFKILLDVKAMCSEDKPIPQIIQESWPHFAHFHANDKNLKGPGFGEVDFLPIASALKKVGYQGYVSVEVFNFEDGAETIATKSLAYLKGVFESP